VKKLILAVILCCAAINLLAKPNERPAKNQNSAHDQAPNTVTFINNEEPHAQADAPKNRPPHWYATSEWWLVVVAAITALFIGRQASEAAKATKAAIDAAADANRNAESSRKQTDDLLKLTRETAIQDQRAYVCLTTAKIMFKDLKMPEIHIHMKNCGKTPAYDVRWWNATGIFKHPLDDVVLPSPSPNLRFGQAVIAPGTEPHIMIAGPRQPIEDQIVQMVLHGDPRATLYQYGRVVYKDAFGIERHTSYRLIHGGDGVHLKNVNGVPTAILKPDHGGNEAD
jgi:hypothetical protein